MVHKLLLDHEGSQVGCVTGQKNDSKEGPHRHHDLAGCAFRVLDRYRVVEDQAPEEPYSFSNCKRRPMGSCRDRKNSYSILTECMCVHARVCAGERVQWHSPVALEGWKTEAWHYYDFPLSPEAYCSQLLFGFKIISIFLTFPSKWIFTTFLKKKIVMQNGFSVKSGVRTCF